jgi:hypothetical protein
MEGVHACNLYVLINHAVQKLSMRTLHTEKYVLLRGSFVRILQVGIEIPS